MKAKAMGRRTVQIMNTIVNYLVLMVIVAALAFAGYAVWDSKQIYQEADRSVFAVYKPTAENEGKTFKELQALNPEVFTWLTVYGTNIDYPVTQGADNMKYVNTNAEGLYSLSGSIFLDCRNNKDFSDFNHILYGHHMEKKTMFGEIGYFSDKKVFEAHKYGNLFYEGKNHGIQFFAFVHTDAYDGAVFTANVEGDEIRRVYLEGLLGKAKHKRDVGVTAEDHIILLSTCSSGSTNGRDILAGRITDRVYEDPFAGTGARGRAVLPETNNGGGYVKEVFLWLPLLMLIITARLVYSLVTRLGNKQLMRKTERRYC